MNDLELRALVRDAVARHLGGGSVASEQEAPRGRSLAPGFDHPSHAVYVSVVNDTGSCVIEPGVRCNHCNYCKSHGH